MSDDIRDCDALELDRLRADRDRLGAALREAHAHQVKLCGELVQVVDERDTARAQLQAVAGLPEKWRAHYPRGAFTTLAYERCARELTAALETPPGDECDHPSHRNPGLITSCPQCEDPPPSGEAVCPICRGGTDLGGLRCPACHGTGRAAAGDPNEELHHWKHDALRHEVIELRKRVAELKEELEEAKMYVRAD